MNRMTTGSVISCVAVFILCTVSPVCSQSFAQYCNPRYGFCVDYPNSLTMKTVPDNDDGREFHDSNGFLLISSGSNNILDDTVETEMKSQSKDIGKITYQAKRKNWLVLSGHIGSDIVYVKTHVGKGTINRLYVKCPAKLNAKYSDAVTKISQSFQPGNLDEAHQKITRGRPALS